MTSKPSYFIDPKDLSYAHVMLVESLSMVLPFEEPAPANDVREPEPVANDVEPELVTEPVVEETPAPEPPKAKGKKTKAKPVVEPWTLPEWLSALIEARKAQARAVIGQVIDFQIDYLGNYQSETGHSNVLSMGEGSILVAAVQLSDTLHHYRPVGPAPMGEIDPSSRRAVLAAARSWCPAEHVVGGVARFYDCISSIEAKHRKEIRSAIVRPAIEIMTRLGCTTVAAGLDRLQQIMRHTHPDAQDVRARFLWASAARTVLTLVLANASVRQVEQAIGQWTVSSVPECTALLSLREAPPRPESPKKRGTRATKRVSASAAKQVSKAESRKPSEAARSSPVEIEKSALFSPSRSRRAPS